MSDSWVLIVAILAIGVLYVLLPWTTHVFARYRAPRAVRCPEACTTAWVEIDASRAAWTAAFGVPRLHVKDCSLWAERGGCARACLQPSAAPTP